MNAAFWLSLAPRPTNVAQRVSALIPLLVFAAVLAALAVWRRWAGLMPLPDGPRCGRCGYNVTGLPSSICPECGSDLRAVGTATPRPRWTPGRGLCLFLWTALVLWLAIWSLETVEEWRRYNVRSAAWKWALLPPAAALWWCGARYLRRAADPFHLP